MKLTQFLVAMTACVISFSSIAQWQWVDKDGRKVFSDRPPPSDVPDKNIINQPNSRLKTTGDAPVMTAVPALITSKPGEGIDKSLMEKKAQAEASEASKRKAEEERIARTKADNCTRALQAKAGVDSGTRLSRINEKGEREFYDEMARAVESQRIQSTIDANCR